MLVNQLIQLYGTIVKEESIILHNPEITGNYSIAEANLPYSDYYGSIPKKPKPNSLFLLTEQYYTLVDVLRFAHKSEICALHGVNIASSVLCFYTNHFPAIRLKNFPDYKQLPHLQECFIKQGVTFLKKIHIPGNALIKTNKYFNLKEVGINIYLDNKQEKTGYIFLSKLIRYDEFLPLIENVKNNTDCPLFDAAWGGVIYHSKVIDIVRIYSEKLDSNLLENIRNRIEKIL